jgi:hypothetical protein
LQVHETEAYISDGPDPDPSHDSQHEYVDRGQSSLNTRWQEGEKPCSGDACSNAADLSAWVNTIFQDMSYVPGYKNFG